MLVVKIEDLKWKYLESRRQILSGINLKVEKGEFLAIMGPTGAGKTTLVLALNGTIPQRIPGEFSGRVEVLNMDTLKYDVSDIAKRIALVFEDPEIQFVMSNVEDEIVLGLEWLNISREEIEERIEWALDLVGLNKSFLVRQPNQLSGGEKQRIAIATAIARKPEILVLDEPTSDLDPRGKSEVISSIKKLRDEMDLTIIMVEHESDLVSELADRIIVLDNGRIIVEGDPSYVFRKIDYIKNHGVFPPEYVEIGLKLGVNGFPRNVEDLIARLREKNIKVRQFEEKQLFRDKAKIVEVRNVEYAYPDGIVALRGVNLDIFEKELIALVGPNGSGKTTLAKIIAGLLKPVKGEVLIDGRPIENYDRLKLSEKIGYVYQNPEHQIFNQTVWDEVAFGLKLRNLNYKDIEEKVEKCLEKFKLKRLAREHPFFLSKGEKRRLALASTYALKPKVMIVDEPTTGQDKRFSEEIMKTLKVLTEYGGACLVITHSISIAVKYCDRIVVLKDGKVIADGNPRLVLLNERVVEEGKLTTPATFKIYKELNLPTPPPVTVEEFIERVKISC
ncbi:MAG: ABC transporter ATP-binding protein [Thermoproteales archaeon]|nr:ABC transporter ATP-binding protein [Thermoproteales archaeon]